MAFMDFQEPRSPGIEKSNWGEAWAKGQMNALNLQNAKDEAEQRKQSNDLAKQYNAETDEGKKKDIFKQLSVTDPKRAEGILNVMKGMSDQDYVQTQRQADQLGRIAFGVMQNPSDMDKIFPTLDPNVQKQITSMGYDPTAPMDDNKANSIKKIGQYFVGMAQDTKTLADHAYNSDEKAKDRDFTKEEKAKDRDFTKGENALNRENRLVTANISANASLEGHRISERAQKYATDANVKLYQDHLKGNNSPSDKHNYEAMTEKAYGIEWMRMSPQEKMDAIDRTRRSYEQGGYSKGSDNQESQDSWKNYR